MEISYHTLTKSLGTSYTDYRDRPVQLTADELAYFRATVDAVLKATGLTIPVYTCDHEKLPGTSSDALGIHWRRTDGGDEFITLDNFYIHEAYEVAFCDGFDMTGETIVSVLCHELAHIRYQRHTRYHAALTARYIDIVKGAAA